MTGPGRLWGGRFAEGPAAAAEALGRSVHFDARLWPHDLAASRAHADELHRVGLLTVEHHAALLGGLDRLVTELEGGTFAFLDDDEDLHGALERRLVELVGPDVGGRLRAGRSRNDQIATHLRRYVAEAADEAAALVADLALALVEQAEATADWLAPGYTHVQRAQPVTLGHHLLAHAWALDRDRVRLLGVAASARASCPLGAGALAGTTLGLDPARYAAALGFDAPAANSMDAVAERDVAAEWCFAGALLGVHVSRLAEEIVLWASTEWGWARVGDAYSTGSSIMPQKRNPDVAELARGKSGRLVGALTTVLVVLKGLPLTYDRDLQEDKEPVFDVHDTLRLVLPALAGTVRSLVFDRERLAAGAGAGHALATDVAEALVRAGVPFREAHERVGALVADADRRTVDVADLPRDVIAAALPELDPSELPSLLDPAAAVARRSQANGPAPAAVRASTAVLRARFDSPGPTGAPG